MVNHTSVYPGGVWNGGRSVSGRRATALCRADSGAIASLLCAGRVSKRDPHGVDSAGCHKELMYLRVKCDLRVRSGWPCQWRPLLIQSTSIQHSSQSATRNPHESTRARRRCNGGEETALFFYMIRNVTERKDDALVCGTYGRRKPSISFEN